VVVSAGKKIYFSGLSAIRLSRKPGSMKKFYVHDGGKEAEQSTTQIDHKRGVPGEKNASLRWLLLVPMLILLAVLAAISRQSHRPVDITVKPEKLDRPQQAVETGTGEENKKKKIRNNIRSYVKTATNTYEHGRLGGISNLKISVTNTTDYLLDQVRVKITYIKANGGIWDTKYEDYTIVEPHASLTHTIPDTKRGTHIEYEMVAVKSKVLGMN